MKINIRFEGGGEYDGHDAFLFLTDVSEIFSVELAKKNDFVFTKTRKLCCVDLYETKGDEILGHYKFPRSFSEDS